MDAEEELDKISATSLRARLSQFSLATPSPSPSPSRRSSRLQARVTIASDGGGLLSPSPSPTKKPSRKRKSMEVSMELTIAEKVPSGSSPSKKKKGYSPPEVYAHLDGLQDRLGDELDVLFCGINPGKRSAEVGFHYAHPSNQFWKVIHESGWTDRKIDPSEEHILPSTYNVGLTDLVERPTAMAIELARQEMVDGVSSLLAKITKYRPRTVCFVGMEIGQIVEKKLKARLGLTTREVNSTKKNSGLLQYKIVHSSENSEEPDNVAQSEKVLETLLYVIPSTSGAAGTYPRAAKVELLVQLRKLMQDHKAGNLDTSQMTIIPTPNDNAQTPAESK